MRFAAIADVHGNLWALEAVLADIARRGIRDIVNAGDHLAGPLDHDGTARLLMDLALPSVSGNQDRELIGGTHGRWLETLPLRRELPGDVLMFNGTPERDDVYLLESVRSSGEVTLASIDEITERLGGVTQTLLICGHTHIPRAIALPGRLIVNPGSVGLQGYEDDAPLPHVMETGSPQARYAILERSEAGGWHVEHVAIGYDAEAAARMAERNGRLDWAWRLRTGRVLNN